MMPDAPLNTFGVYSAEELLEKVIPPREPLMGNWLVKGSILLLYATRGVGKSNFALGLATAITKGESFLGFPSGQQGAVLVVDGEMPAYELQRRVKAMSGGSVPAGLHFYSSALMDTPMDSLSTDEGQDLLMNIAEALGTKILILDNKSTLMYSRDENSAESYERVQTWMIRMRNMGYTIILVHHAGKGGEQRGSSMHEVTPDIIIKLGAYKGQQQENMSQFTLFFEKTRHLAGKELNPKLVTFKMEGERTQWDTQPLSTTEGKAEQAKALSQQGLSQRKIAEELGTSVSTVNGYLREA